MVPIFISSMLPYTIIAGAAFLLLRQLSARRKGIRRDPLRELCLVLFTGFFVGLLSLTVMPRWYMDGGHIYAMVRPFSWDFTRSSFNSVPFDTIQKYFDRGHDALFVINILGNIAMFMPVGFCLPLLWKRWQGVLRVTLVSMLLSCTIEFLQIFVYRSVDIDDVILNTLGGLLGYICWRIFNLIFKKLSARLAK